MIAASRDEDVRRLGGKAAPKEAQAGCDGIAAKASALHRRTAATARPRPQGPTDQLQISHLNYFCNGLCYWSVEIILAIGTELLLVSEDPTRPFAAAQPDTTLAR